VWEFSDPPHAVTTRKPGPPGAGSGRKRSSPVGGKSAILRIRQGVCPMLTRSSLVRATVAVLALSAGASARPAVAQPPANSPWLFLSSVPDADKDADPAAAPTTIWESGRHRVLLRPNVEQGLFLYIRNPTERDQTLTVVLAAGPDAG